jgi:hypothetical protein
MAAVDVELEARRKRALELHLDDVSYADIAKELGCSKANAHKLVKSALDSRVETPSAEGADPTDLSEIARLDVMLKGLWPKASTGDIASIDRVMRIEERKFKLQVRAGLVEPPKDEDGDDDGGTPESTVLSELERRRAERAAAEGEGRSAG